MIENFHLVKISKNEDLEYKFNLLIFSVHSDHGNNLEVTYQLGWGEELSRHEGVLLQAPLNVQRFKDHETSMKSSMVMN